VSGADTFLQGVDVSKYQSQTPSLAGVHFLIARAGIAEKPDPTYGMHIANAKKAGIATGSYYYNWGALSVSEQVDYYRKIEGDVDIHVIDWEGTEGFTAAQTADFIRIYKARSGNRMFLYASEGRFRDLGQDGNWIANYSREPSKAYDIWQYGPFRGADGNRIRGTIIDLNRIIGHTGANDMSISTSGLTLTTDYAVSLPAGSAVHESPDGASPLVGTFGGQVDYFGSTGGFKAVRVAGVNGSVIGYTATAATAFRKPAVPVVDPTPFTQVDVDKAETTGEETGALAEKARIRGILGL